LKFSKQAFNRTAASISATALTLAAIALVIPTVFHQAAAGIPVALGGWTPAKEQALSLAIAVVLFLTYALMLIFTLVTHRQLFGGLESKGVAKAAGAELTIMEAEQGQHTPWSIRKALGILLGATALVAMVSEFLVGAIEQARETLGLTEVFVGVIVVAIVGNAAEHSSAILMAIRNKMDISIGIAIGSSLQIALFVAPLLLFASYVLGAPMDLEFTMPEVVAVVVSIIIVEQISGDGESNWVEGMQLLSVYAILAILFYFLPDAHPAPAGLEGVTSPAPAHP
jgi:Ca2+:H+ antiporter